MPESATTYTPSQPVEPQKKTLSKQQREKFGQALYDSIDATLGDRQNLDNALQHWSDLYEMRTFGRNSPWPNAADLPSTLIPEMIETLAARLSGVVFQPRFYVVNGNTPQAAAVQNEVERYYNAELYKHGWDEAYYTALHLALRDGTSVMEVKWRKTTTKRKLQVQEPQTDPETGQVIIDPMTGEPLTHKVLREVEFEDYNDVEYTPIELQDFLVIPAWQYSIEAAHAVAVAHYMDEAELRRLSTGDKAVLWPDAVEAALSYVQPGESERGYDRQGYNDATIGGKINIGVEEGSPQPDIGQQRGPIKVWMVYSRQFDFEDGGVPEDYIFWVHERSQKLIGADPYRYWMGRWNLEALTLMPRPGRFYGYSVCERLDPIQTEERANREQRIDMIGLYLSPPMYEKNGAKVEDENKKWGPMARWKVQNADDVGTIAMPNVPQETWIQQQDFKEMAFGLMGLSDNQLARPNSGRRTKAEVQQVQQSSGVRLDLMARQLRKFAKNVFQMTHELKLQYAPDQMQTDVSVGGRPQTLFVEKEKLGQDFSLSIQGEGGPLDKSNRLQEILFLYSLLMKNPLIMQNPMHVYQITRMVLEEFNRPDIPNLIGTPEEAQQMAQQQQQMQQMQAMAGAMGQKPQNGQQPQQQAKPQGPMGM